MNKISLTFFDKNLEKLYFFDQLDELINFYRYICILGTISTFAFILMEFITPLGFGSMQYFLLVLPIFFWLSYKLVYKYSVYINIILGAMNLFIGITLDGLLIVFLDQSFLFIAGQAVALVQYSLLIGTNMMANILILMLNQCTILAISIYFNRFTSMQVMLVFALLLIIKSIWVSHKTKRQFFLTKALNTKIYHTLNQTFNLGVAHCHFNERERQIQLYNTESNLFQQFKSQSQFTEFIRKYFVVSQNSSLQAQEKQQISLEILLFEHFNKQSNNSTEKFMIYSQTQKEGFTVCFLHTIQNKKKVIILLFSQENYLQKIFELQNSCKRQMSVINNFIDISENSRQVLAYTNLIQKVHNVNNLLLFKQKLLLYQIVNNYYNIILLGKYKSIGKVIKFSLHQLFSELIGIFNQMKSVVNISEYENYQMNTNYLLLFQLFLNLILPNIKKNYQCCIFIQPQQLFEVHYIEFVVQFQKVLTLFQQTNSLNNNNFIQQPEFLTNLNQRNANKLILSIISLDSEIKTIQDNYSITYSAKIICDLNQIYNK